MPQKKKNLNLEACMCTFETVRIFENILKRRIVLKDGEGVTDGITLFVPLRDSDLSYTISEHLLSHIVFKTDNSVIQKFSSAYATILKKNDAGEKFKNIHLIKKFVSSVIY